jgi:hypothetical protein
VFSSILRPRRLTHSRLVCLPVVPQTMSVDPLRSKQLSSDEVARQMLTLLVELLRSGELPELAIGGAWMAINYCLEGRPSLGPTAMELGLFDLGMEHLRRIGSPADAIRISRGKAGRGFAILVAPYGITRLFSGQEKRADLDACVRSGMFDFCLDSVVAFAAAGVEGLQDTHHCMLATFLAFLAKMPGQPGCEDKIRSAASALAFCLAHSLDQAQELGSTSGGMAARVCCSVFGRDEGGSEFTFTPQHIELLTEDWSQNVRAVGYSVNKKPTADIIFAVELCVSDVNKPLLIDNQDFIPYLVDALLLVSTSTLDALVYCPLACNVHAQRLGSDLCCGVVRSGPGSPTSRHEGGAQGLVPASPLRGLGSAGCVRASTGGIEARRVGGASVGGSG